MSIDWILNRSLDWIEYIRKVNEGSSQYSSCGRTTWVLLFYEIHKFILHLSKSKGYSQQKYEVKLIEWNYQLIKQCLVLKYSYISQ